MMKRLPFLLAIIIAAAIILPAFDRYIKPSEASTDLWSLMNERDKQMYLIGYITANTVWSNGLSQSHEIERLPDSALHVYRLLSPASSYQWPELLQAIDAQIRDGLPIWEIIHTYANTVRDTYKGDI